MEEGGGLCERFAQVRSRALEIDSGCAYGAGPQGLKPNL